ncbi:exodeoxyribonuclease V subunit alpha [Halomonas sp. WWR20]
MADSGDSMPVQGVLFDDIEDSDDPVATAFADAAEVPPATLPRLAEVLETWVQLGWLRALDVHFVRFLEAHEAQAEECVLLAAALASHQLGRGHVCLDLAQALRDPGAVLSLPPQDGRHDPNDPQAAVVSPERLLASLDLNTWIDCLGASRLVSAPAGESATHEQTLTPLVLHGTRLYLRRYWQCERAVAERLATRMGAPLEVSAMLRQRLDALFADNHAGAGEHDWQKAAVALALRNRLTVISGGPGTGKTTTVTRLLALLQEAALYDSGRALNIRLVAPTGKAAARLTESIGGALARLDVDEAVRASLPREATTLHRLLGARPDTRHFRHDARSPLALDLLVVDEASMVDLELMAALLEALPDEARLILLGDKDQLASVEAGSVLGDLCQEADNMAYSPDTVAYLGAMTGEDFSDSLRRDIRESQGGVRLADHVVVLRKSYRFGSASGIGALARAANAGDGLALGSVWRSDFADIAWRNLDDEQDRLLERTALQGYRPYLRLLRDGAPADAILAAFAHFQVLCALRRGPWGVEGLNQRIGEALYRDGLITATRGWYAGRPVMVTRNDPGLGLYNGDVGITLADPTMAGRLRVFFAQGERVRAVLPGRLTDVETVFAMTVHKSQGSEFEHVLFVLPDRPNPILTKELAYTGVTRAKSRVTLMSSYPRALESAIAKRVIRASGLRF